MQSVLRHIASAAAGGAAVLLFVLATGERDRPGTGEAPGAPPADPDRESRALQELRAENEILAQRGRDLEKDLTAARDDLEQARRRLETPPPGAGPDTRVLAPPARAQGAGGADSPRVVRRNGAGGGPGDEPPALPDMKRYVVFGEGLSDEAVEKLRLDENERSRIESAIADEEERLHAALDLFALEAKDVERPRPGESTPALLTRLLQESGMVESLTKFHQENPDGMKMLREGQVSLRDVLGETSDAYRLLAALRENRRQTHDDVGRILDPDRAAVFAREIHPPGIYSFKGNLHLALMGPVTPEDAAEAATRTNGDE